MRHSAATIHKLIQTGYDVFRFRRKLLNAAIALGLIFFGLYADPSMFMPMIALIAGCVMLANLNAVPRMQANEVLKQIGNKFPKSDYSFYEKEFKDHDKADPIPYTRLIRLIEDRQYLYLYVAEQSGYMVDKGTFSGGSVSDFKTYLEIETGMTFSRPASLFSFKITDILPRKDPYQGPRLK
jgi:hypothetical protein